MNKAWLLLPLALLLTSCASLINKQEKKEYLDLTKIDDDSLIDEYWVVEKRVTPKYPLSAARQSISGCVEFIIGINEEGKIQGYEVVKSYPKRLFDEHAQAALVSWQYKPSKENTTNQPVLVSVQLDFIFNKDAEDKSFDKHCQSDSSSS